MGRGLRIRRESSPLARAWGYQSYISWNWKLNIMLNETTGRNNSCSLSHMLFPLRRYCQPYKPYRNCCGRARWLEKNRTLVRYNNISLLFMILFWGKILCNVVIIVRKNLGTYHKKNHSHILVSRMQGYSVTRLFFKLTWMLAAISDKAYFKSIYF